MGIGVTLLSKVGSGGWKIIEFKTNGCYLLRVTLNVEKMFRPILSSVAIIIRTLFKLAFNTAG